MQAQPLPWVQCSVCGLRFDPDHAPPACQVCPLGGLIRRCGLVRCPHCGFEQPAPWGPRARVGRRQRGAGRGKGAAPQAGPGSCPGGGGEGSGGGPDAIRLSDLAQGERARILRLDARGSGLHKLLALGMVPGVEVTLVQSRPMPVVRAGYTTLAVDPELARTVAVLRLEGEPGWGRGARRRGQGQASRRGWGFRGWGRGAGRG